ncbi:hypothetical protein C8039_15215 [Halogeometricum sp. wsp3]|nr:hypothetical protein C8039_15215 [Halogeometricum sp. wsp3]
MWRQVDRQAAFVAVCVIVRFPLSVTTRGTGGLDCWPGKPSAGDFLVAIFVGIVTYIALWLLTS